MSLKIWLPLDGDLRNLGCSDVTVTNNGATVNNSGKIGKCYSPATITITNINNLSFDNSSYCFWAKTNSTSSWQKIIMIDNSDNSQIHGIYIADSARLKLESNPSLNIYNAEIGSWHHYAFVVKDGKSCCYRDGVLQTTSSEAVTNDTIGRLRLGVGTSIFLNDVRIYDHCLSAAEVKEIAQGLVLHYKLDNITNGIIDSSGYGHNGTIIGDLIPSSDTKRYSTSTRWNCSSPTDNSETGICYIQTPFTLTTPLQLTVAWWAKPESGYGGSTMHSAFCTSSNSSRPTDYNITALHHRDAGFDIYPSDGSGVKRLSFTYVQNEWHHYAITYDGTTAKSYKDGVLQTNVTIGTNKTLATFSQLYIGYSQAGGVRRKTLGNYSDFRIYCTPLLDTDIKLLYNIGMRVDNLGGVHSFEFNEISDEKLLKTGILQTNELEETSIQLARLQKDKGWLSSEFIEI